MTRYLTSKLHPPCISSRRCLGTREACPRSGSGSRHPTNRPFTRWRHFPANLPAMHPLLTPANLATALIAVNFAAFAAFGIDRAKAEAGAWRLSESTLLWLALLGGTPGAYAGRSAFRHKTRKQPFNSHLFSIAVLQVLGLGGWLGWGMV